MTQKGSLGRHFLSLMASEQQKKLNSLPEDLRPPVPQIPQPIFQSYSGFVQYHGLAPCLSRADIDAFNIVVLGPTGSGKSHLINLLFNCEVCQSAGSAESVTREMQIHSGRCVMLDKHVREYVERKVNIIDSIGFCDATLSSDIILQVVQQHLRVNFAYVDYVLFVCHGRIEENHVSAIKALLKWMRYDKYYEHFLFVYNKADLVAENLRMGSLSAMCNLLQVNPRNFRMGVEKSPSEMLPENRVGQPLLSRTSSEFVNLPRCFATAFPPSASFHEIQQDLYKLGDSLFLPMATCKRIPMESSWCEIL